MILHIFNIMKSKVLILMVSGIISGIVFMTFNYYTHATSYTIAPKGDVVIIKSLKINNYQDSFDGLQYDKLFMSTGFLYNFYESSKTNFNYNKLAPGWNNQTDMQRIDWMRRHIKVSYFGAGRMEFLLRMQKSEPMDLTYLQANGDRFITALIEFADNKEHFGNYEILSTTYSIPDSLVVNNDGVVIKYGIIGFVLGIFLMMTIIWVLDLHKRTYGKY